MKFFTYIYQKRTIDAIHWSAVVLDYCNVLCNVFLLILIDPNILSWSQMFFPVLSTSRQSVLNCNILSTDALHRVIMFTNFVLKLNGIVTQPYLGLEKLPLICFFLLIRNPQWKFSLWVSRVCWIYELTIPYARHYMPLAWTFFICTLNVDKNRHFSTPSPSSCLCSYWMPPY